MLGAECLLADGDGALIERLGLLVAAGVPVEIGQVVEGLGNVRVLGAECLLADGDGALIERLGLLVAAGAIQLFPAILPKVTEIPRAYDRQPAAARKQIGPEVEALVAKLAAAAAGANSVAGSPANTAPPWWLGFRVTSTSTLSSPRPLVGGDGNNDGTTVTISGSGTDRILTARDTLSLVDLKLTNGFARGGGAIYANCDSLAIINCDIFDNRTTEGNGGGISAVAK